MKIEIKGTELVRVLTNVNLWLDETPAVFYICPLGIFVHGTDDYLAVMDWCPVRLDPPTAEIWFELHAEDFDVLLTAAREVKSKDLSVDVTPGSLVVPYHVERDEKDKIVLTEGSSSLVTHEADEFSGWLEIFSEAMDTDCVKMERGFAIRAERWLKLCRVKAEKDAPIDVRFLPDRMAAIKIGSSFRALVRFLDRGIAKEAIEKKEMMW